MHVAELWRYPVKSMRGERLEQAELTLEGIPGDRGLYVVDAAGGIVSARTRPGLLGLAATYDQASGEVLVDELPWRHPLIAAEVERAAGQGARIVRATGPERFDILPLLVATDGAIEAFGYDYRRLRPNVVLGGVEGLAERGWEGEQVAVGDAVIGLATLRGRCITTTYDPDTLVQDVDVLRSIQARFDGTLALNAWAGQPGAVHVGDEAHVLAAHADLARPQLGRFV
jgi:hypothetical protein